MKKPNANEIIGKVSATAVTPGSADRIYHFANKVDPSNNSPRICESTAIFRMFGYPIFPPPKRGG